MTDGAQPTFAILDNSPIGHFIIDQNLTLLFWNRCLEEWTGMPREMVVGAALRDLFPQLATPKYLNRIETILRGEPPTTFSSQLHSHIIPAPLPGGRMRIQHTVVSPLASGRQGSYLALFSIQDVTSLTEAINQHGKALATLTAEVSRRTAAEESLRDMDRRKNVFIASAAHELNAPLATIQGYAEMLRDMGHLIDDQRKTDYANEIYESAQVLSKIINDLLDIARFEEGCSIHMEMTAVDPNDLIRKTVRHFMDRRTRHPFTLDLEPACGRTVTADPTRISQVLENVIGNAVKYSPGKTGISIRSAWDDSGVVIVITDQGIGMSAENAAKIFEKFFRADNSETSVRGLGLGMCIVKQIVDQHGGTITIDSHVGRGTAVSIRLRK